MVVILLYHDQYGKYSLYCTYYIYIYIYIGVYIYIYIYIYQENKNTYFCFYSTIIYLLLPGILQDEQQQQQQLVEHNPGNLTPSQISVYQYQ